MHACEVCLALTLGAHTRSPGAGIKDGNEPPEVGPGQEQYTLLTANPSPQILLLLFQVTARLYPFQIANGLLS